MMSAKFESAAKKRRARVESHPFDSLWIVVIFEELIALLFVLLSHLVWQRRWIDTRKTTIEGGCLLGCSVHHQAKRAVCHAQNDRSHGEVRRDGTAISSESKASTRRQSDEVPPPSSGVQRGCAQRREGCRYGPEGWPS
jgi:hypothetical protein